MRRFFVSAENISSDQVRLDQDQSRHMEKVLRLKPGEQFQAFDGSGREYTVLLAGKENGCLIGKIQAEGTSAVTSALRLTLVQGIAKGDKMDTIIQKAVEVGYSCIIPVVTQHTVVHLQPDRAEKKLARWQTIAREACKQCRRSIIPEIKPVMKFDQALTHLGGRGIMLYENEEHIRLRDILEQIRKEEVMPEDIALFIGPEGGFSEDEVNQAMQQGVQVAGLGPYILRTETAGLVAASIVLYEYGEIG